MLARAHSTSNATARCMLEQPLCWLLIGGNQFVLAGAHSTSSCLQMFININNDPLQYPGGFLCSLRHTPAHVLYR